MGVPALNLDGRAWHRSDRSLKEIIREGSPCTGQGLEIVGLPEEHQAEALREIGLPEKPAMPAFQGRLSEGDIDAVVAYMKTLWADQQRRFQRENPTIQ